MFNLFFLKVNYIVNVTLKFNFLSKRLRMLLPSAFAVSFPTRHLITDPKINILLDYMACLVKGGSEKVKK